MLSVWAAILLFVIIGAIFSAGGIMTAFLIQPRHSSKVKLETYECGPETVGPVKIRFRASYFMYALVFVLFDVETVFLYPWAVRFKSLGFFAFVEMTVFIFILVLGLWYAWKEGALEWM